MPAPQLIRDLVARFHEHQDSYRAETYSEAQLRQEFLNPCFEALGWDIYNRQGYAKAYKDVAHEDSIKIGGATRAPDYCFRIGGSRKFFVEAKKPAVNLRQDVAPAYQLRRYAWSAKLPLSILTDFEELAVYDCRVRPEHNDAASKARTLYLTCEPVFVETQTLRLLRRVGRSQNCLPGHRQTCPLLPGHGRHLHPQHGLLSW